MTRPLGLLGAVALGLALGALAPADSRAEAAVSHGVSAFGELKYPADFAHFDYVNPDAPKGGRISVRPAIATRTFDSFNPYIFKGDAADGATLLFDTLMAAAFDEPDAVYGLVAESIEMPADRSHVVFRLRPEARFADGSALTAEDVAWSILTLRDRGDAPIALSLRAVKDAEALDPATVRVDFDPEFPTRDMAARVGALPIFSKTYFETRDFEESSLEPPLGSGPYRVDSFEQGRTVTYARRDDYWAKDLPVRRGKYNFDAITFEYFVDQDVAFSAFRAGAFDLNEVFISRNWATKYDFEEIQEGLVIKETLPDGRPSGTQGFWLNTRKPQLSDPRVREALDLAFDFEWSNRALFFNLYDRTSSIFQNSDLEASGPPSPEELALLEPFRDSLPPSVFEAAYTPPTTDGSGRNRRNIGRAARLLTEAGWTVRDKILVNAAGEPLEIEFLDRVGSTFERIVDPYIQNLEKLGIKARLRQVDAAQYELRVKSFDYDIITGRFVMQSTPGPELNGYFSSVAAEAEGSFNLTGLASPAVDALLTAIEQARSREELRAATRALDRVFRAGHYWTPHWYKASHALAYWNKFGRPMDLGIEKPPYDRAILSTWWFDPAKAEELAARRGR